MRICLVVPYDLCEEGGVKRHAIQLARTLIQLGDEVDVVGPTGGGGALGERVHGFGGVVTLPKNGSENHVAIFANPWRVWNFFRLHRYDVVHVHEPLVPTLNWYAVWSAGRRAARVATFHAFNADETPWALRIRRLASAAAYGSYDRGIAVSPAAGHFAAATFDKPIAIIPNGISRGAARPPETTSRNGPVRLLFVGHWRDTRKGLPILLDACARLEVPWTLDVVGDGGGAPRTEVAGVRYHGPINSEERVAAMYAACDVFVAPSTGMESFGIVLLEAMAAGRAIVCSDIEGYRYAVGDAARLVPPGSPGALADALRDLARDPAERQRLGSLGRDRVGAFEWDRLAHRVRAEYIAALRSRRGASDRLVMAAESDNGV